MKISKGFRLSLACTAALLGAVYLSAPDAHAAEMETLHFSYPEANAFYWDFDVAREKGFFTDEHFKLDHITGASTPQVIQMLISGDLQLVTPQPDALLIAITRGGSNLGVIAQPALVPDWILTGGKGIKSFAEVKGKTLGVSARGGSEETLAEEILAAHGVKRSDIKVIVAGLTPAKFAALAAGSIAAAVLYQPTAQLAHEKGYTALFRFSQLKPPYPPSYYATNRKWAAEKDHGVRIRRVLERAHKWLFDPKNRNEAITILQKYTKRDKEILGKIYDQYFVTDKIYTPDAKVRLEGTQTIIDAMVKRGQLKKDQLTPKQVVLSIAVAK
jgi:ABC-type nitrate/sulfonate/bicarbonate transport system substrate-binding protein